MQIPRKRGIAADRCRYIPCRCTVLHLPHNEKEGGGLMKLEVDALRFSYGSTEILKGVSMEFDTGINAVLGPNGAGKSTLVKCLSGVHKPSSGTATFDGESLIHRDPYKINMTYMSQETPHISNLTVLEFMLLGRANELKLRVSEDDIDLAYSPLHKLGIEEFADRNVGELSGGQAQMVMIAQCLVSDPDLIILDEPMNNLDLKRELDIFEIIREEHSLRELTTVMVLHDLNFASRYCDRIVVMDHGEVYSSGTPQEVITPEMLRDVYRVEAEVAINS
ncbi:MAG: ABC transporter ATP-binding protein [Thermoplasmata archaeon]|nr:ABC transporter ATP-binding protein [Thermoplasmata archaeon]